MIIFGNRAHYSAIGGVENSIRSLLKVVSDRQSRAIMVCREPIANESLDVASMDLPSGVELMTFKDEYSTHPMLRLPYLPGGGKSLSPLYSELFTQYPDAVVVVRHHMHVLAAHRAGYRDVRYLVPSVSINQLRAEQMEGPILRRLRLFIHMAVDGWLQVKAFKLAKLYVFSVSMEEQVRQRLPRLRQNVPINKVLPGIDLTRFKPATDQERSLLRQRLNLPTEDKLILFVGRFVQAKGLQYLLSSMASMPIDYKLILVGEGEFESAMRTQVKSLSLDNRVIFAGSTSRPEDYYRACDSFVMSSTYEPLGQTILEAAACGLRVAAFSAQAGVDTATQELGLDEMIHYADNLTAASLRQAITLSLEASVTRKLAESDRLFRSSFSWEALLAKLIE